MAFKCEKCGAELKNEMALTMHKKNCGVKPVPSSLKKPGVAVSGVSSAATGFAGNKSRFALPGPNKRICAYLIDMAIIYAVTSILNLGIVINLAIQTMFILFRDSVDGQSPGKRFAGLVVHDLDGKTALPQSCALRNITLALPGVVLLFGAMTRNEIPGLIILVVMVIEYSMTRNSAEGRRIGDMIAGTRVNDNSPEKGDTRFFWFSLAVVMISGFINTTMTKNQVIENAVAEKNVQTASIQWESFVSPEGYYSISLPGKAKEETKEIQSGKNNLATRMVNVKAENMEFVVIATRFPGSIDNAPIDKMFEGGKTNLLASKVDKLESELKISSGEHPGREYNVALGNSKTAKLRVRMFINVKGRSMLLLMVQYDLKDYNSAALDKFLDSVKIQNP